MLNNTCQNQRVLFYQAQSPYILSHKCLNNTAILGPVSSNPAGVSLPLPRYSTCYMISNIDLICCTSFHCINLGIVQLFVRNYKFEQHSDFDGFDEHRCSDFGPGDNLYT